MPSHYLGQEVAGPQRREAVRGTKVQTQVSEPPGPARLSHASLEVKQVLSALPTPAEPTPPHGPVNF